MAVCSHPAFSQLFLCICRSFLHLLTANVLGVGGWTEKVSQSNANKTPSWWWWNWGISMQLVLLTHKKSRWFPQSQSSVSSIVGSHLLLGVWVLWVVCICYRLWTKATSQIQPIHFLTNFLWAAPPHPSENQILSLIVSYIATGIPWDLWELMTDNPVAVAYFFTYVGLG